MNISPLADMIAKHIKYERSVQTSIKGLSLHTSTAPTDPISYMMSPHFCFIAQGKKSVFVNKEVHSFDIHNFLISSVNLPVISQITNATKTHPYLGLTLELDLDEISKVIAQYSMVNDEGRQREVRGIGVSKTPPNLLNAVQRLLELLDTPEDIPILADGVKREIYYRLLTSEQGHRLKDIILDTNKKFKISRITDWIKNNFDKQFHNKELASLIDMSESTFYQHFRSLTSMSPLQYQKRIRLTEARKLMLVDNLNASNASYEVGYESHTQFNREYKKMFGNPPIKDIRMIRDGVINF